MWTLGKFLFFCTILAPRIRGQTYGTLEEPIVYMTAVVDALWERIRDHGISNLPVLDTSMNYDYTAFGVSLIGLISLEDGFVQDIDSVSLNPQNFEWSAPLAHITMTGNIDFKNLRLYRDLRADLSTGMKVGSVVITPGNLSYKLTINKLHGNDTVVPKLSYTSSNNYDWDINPDDPETRLIQAQAANQTKRDPVGPEFVNTTAQTWEPLFNKFLEEIVTKIEFPATSF